MARRTREENIKRAASGGANALNRAIGYLNAAITELAEAGSYADARNVGLDSNDEAVAHAHACEVLASPEDGLIAALTALRDRRAARAGFHFED